MFKSQCMPLLYCPLKMLDERKYSGLLMKKTLTIFFVIFFPLVPKLEYSDDKMHANLIKGEPLIGKQ